jgi:hypothetical protein
MKLGQDINNKLFIFPETYFEAQFLSRKVINGRNLVFVGDCNSDGEVTSLKEEEGVEL